MKKILTFLAYFMPMLFLASTQMSAQEIDENGVLKSWGNPPAKLEIPDNVVKIADNCFCYHVQEGWEESFYPNPDITSIYFNKTQVIGKQAFYQLPNLKTIVSASYVKEVQEQALAECHLLERVDFPAIETLGKYALADCQGLKSIHFGKNLKTVGPKAFKNCPELASLTMEEGGEFYMVKGGLLISKAEGKVMGAATKMEEVNVDEAKIIGEYVFQNNMNLKKIILNNVTELEDGAFCSCSKLIDLRIPKLSKLPGWAPSIFSGCTSLRTLDLHESENFDAVDALTSLPDNDGMCIYVANETIKAKLEKRFNNAKVIVGAPQGEVKTYHVTYTWNHENGTMDVWGKSATTILSGSDVAEHSSVTFKAIPRFKCMISSFTVNGEDVKNQLIMDGSDGKYIVNDVVSDLKVNVEFAPELGHMIFFGATPSDAGEVICKMGDGKEIKSSTIVPANSKLFFEARPLLDGFHIESWLKEKTVGGDGLVAIEGQRGKTTYNCVSEDGLDIRVNFAMNDNHHLLQFRSINETLGTLQGFIDGKEIKPLGAYPDGSVVTLKVTPAADQDINTITWYETLKDDFVELEEYKNKKEISLTLDNKRVISVSCSHVNNPKPGKNDPIIENGHLISWEAIGDVVLPEEVEYINKQAFRGAMEMTKLTFNNKVKNIGEAAFIMCSELSEIAVPEGNPYFKSANGAVYSKDGKKLVVYPGGKKESLYTLPADVEEVIAGALLTTPYLKEVAVEAGNKNYEILGKALVRIADKAMVYYPNADFMNLSAEPKLTMDDGIEVIGRYALAYIPALSVLELSNNLKKIEACATMAAGGLSQIKAREGYEISEIPLEEIGDSAFFYNMSIEELPYIKSLKKIGNEAFARNYNLLTVNIPANCEIGNKAFDYAMALSYIRCYGEEPSKIDDETFSNIQYIENVLLEVPTGCTDVYASAIGWRNFTQIKEFNAGIETGIKDVHAEKGDNRYYTIDGKQVQTPVKNRIYIHNGKKIILK